MGKAQQPLEQKLGYAFLEGSLLIRALTHPSVKQGQDNQRLEFLGDAVLEFCISEMLYQKYPQEQEGELTARRAALVCEDTLCHLAQSLSLGEALRMGHGEEQTMGRSKPSILADALEAVLAAIYLDGGMEAVRGVVLRLYQAEETLYTLRGGDDKGLLQAYTQAQEMALPEYTIIEESGPDHDKHFVAQVSVLSQPVATGEGSSKKAAEQAAAKAALAAYHQR